MKFPKVSDLSLSDAALAYAAAGFRVFPVTPGEKDPPLTSHGFKNGTTDAKQVTEWWTRRPDANIGLATGEGIVAIDLDVKDGKEGVTEFLELQRIHGSLPVGPFAETPSGGKHHFYQCDSTVASSVGVVSPGIDIRADGGYVIVAPSIVGGKVYTLKRTHVEIPDIPEIWKQIVSEKKRRSDPAPDIYNTDFDPAAPERDNHIYAIACTLIARGITDEKTLLDKLYEYNGQFIKGPLSKSVVQKKLVSALNNKGAVSRREVVVELLPRYVYILGVKKFYDLKQHCELDNEQVNSLWSAKIPKGSAVQVFMRHPERVMVSHTTLAPGESKIVERISDGASMAMQYLNLYDSSSITPIDGDPSPFLDIVSHIFGVDIEERNHFIRWMAWQVRNPGQKLQHAVLLQGKPGIGKTFFGKVMRDLIGPRYVFTVKNHDLKGRFNPWMENRFLIMIEEVSEIDRKVMDVLKSLITDKRVTIERKGLDTYETRNFANFFMTTNHRDAIQNVQDDRRIWVYMSIALPKEQSYYIRLMDWVESNHGVILNYLNHVEIPEGFGSMHAPLTKSKLAMDRAAYSDIESLIEEAWKSHESPFDLDLFTVMGIIRWTQMLRVKATLTTNRLGELLKKLGGTQLGRTKRPKSDEWGPNVWCRNESASRYLVYSPRDLFRLLVAQSPESYPGLSDHAPPTEPEAF